MNIVIFVLGIISVIVIAQIINHFIPRIPTPLIEIALGAIVAFDPIFSHFHLDSSFFMLLIIAPLMFNDGQNINRRALARNIWSILGLAIVLVVLTASVLAVGFHFAIPTVSFWAIFVLISIMTPTDATAVSGLTERANLPERLMYILEGESLFNDATGIVAFNFGLLAMKTGNYSIFNGIGNFFFQFLGGILIGLICGYLFVLFQIYLQRIGIDDSAVIVPIQLISPFIIYIIAEHVEVSGILAVVTAGIIHGLEKDRLILTASRLQVVTNNVWQVITDILNGVVFVILGISLTEVFQDVHGFVQYTVSAICIYLAMIIVRWIYIKYFVKVPFKESKIKATTVLTVFGCHGTVTLALALSLPDYFPYYETIIVISGLVILLSLIVPTVYSWFIHDSTEKTVGPDFATAQKEMILDTIRWVKSDLPAGSDRSFIISTLQRETKTSFNIDHKKVHKLFVQTQQIEVAAVKKVAQENAIPNGMLNNYLSYLKFSSFSPMKRFFLGVIHNFLGHWIKYKHELNHKRFKGQDISSKKELILQSRNDAILLEKSGYKAVIVWLTHQSACPEVKQLIAYYSQRNMHFMRHRPDDLKRHDSFIQVFQREYQYVNNQLSQKKLDPEVAKQLREQISYDEMVYMQQQ